MFASFKQVVRPTLSLLLALVLGGCGTNERPTTQIGSEGRIEAQSAIVFGTKVSPNDEHPAAVNTVGLAQKKGAQPFCTGSLITASRVLTAAHCLDKGKAHFVFFGGPQIGKPIYIRIKTFEIYPDYRRGSSAYDIGWIDLEDKAPSPFHAVPIYSNDQLPEPGVSVTTAGYGLSEESVKKPDGKLRAATLSFVAKYEAAPWFQVVELKQIHQGINSGDSGGPTYILDRGQWSILGVTVSYQKDEWDPTNPESVGAGAFTYVPYYRHWLER